MKKRIVAGFALAGLIMAGCSSDFLEITPTSSLTEDSFFKTLTDAEATVTAAYNPLRNAGLYNNDYPKVTEAPTDDAIIYNTQGLSLDSWSFATNDNIIDNVWQTCYEGIFRANMALQKLPEMEINEGAKARMLGEAYFLRALYYWHLTALFGEVPMITEADPTDAGKAVVPKSSVDELYAFMIADLGQAYELLPPQSEYSTANIGRASKGAAEALLGKVYLYAENYPLAEKHLENVISSGEYQLVSDFADLLVVDNNPESIFEVQFADLTNQGSTRMVNNYPQGQGGYANLLPTQDLVDEYEAYDGPTAINGTDPRLHYTIFRQGDPYDDVSPVYQASWTPTGFTMKKGLYPVVRANNANGWRNVPIIRLADVILMYAEAANANGKPDAAIAAINRVRGRPGVEMPALPTAEFPVRNEEEIFAAIVHERRVELAFEYHRLHDIRRWGLGEDVFGSLGFQPKHRYYPLPESEIDNNSELKQNPDYN